MSQEARLDRNAESKSKADHDGEPWSTDEIAFLMDEFDKAKGACDDEAVVAECLGRTIEACRQRFYDTRSDRMRHVVKTTTGVSITHTTVAYIGAEDDPEDQWWSPGYYNDEGKGSHA